MSGFELGTDGPAAVVVGVDGSPTSLRAAAYAAGLARRSHARLVAVYARGTTTALIAMGDRGGQGAAAYREAGDETERELREALDRHRREWQVEGELVVREGDPMAVLSAVAAEARADAVVVGSSSSLGHRVAGSLAVRLVRQARWPVTVVP